MSAEWHDQAHRLMDAYIEFYEESERLELVRKTDDAFLEGAIDFNLEQLGKKVLREYQELLKLPRPSYLARRGRWCPKSGKPWSQAMQDGRCPYCGREVSETLDGTISLHIEADYEYRERQAAEVDALYRELKE